LSTQILFELKNTYYENTFTFFSIFFINLCFCQEIETFNTVDGSKFLIYDPTSTIDQTPSGSGSNWSFSNLNRIGENTDNYSVPNADEQNTFQGTTEVLTVQQLSPPAERKLFLKHAANATYITGATQEGITLNYSGENAYVGEFPMSFNTQNSGPVSGTFSYDGTNGTFTGTFTAEVDAHGNLSLSDNSGGNFNRGVTRLKVVQNLNLFVAVNPFAPVATVNQLSYYYYDSSEDNIAFRTNDVSLVSTLLGNQNSKSFEANNLYTLSVKTPQRLEGIVIYPNPVKDVTNIKIDKDINIVSLKILNLIGQTIYHTKTNPVDLPTNKLKRGLYFVVLETDSDRKYIKKIIKQ